MIIKYVVYVCLIGCLVVVSMRAGGYLESRRAIAAEERYRCTPLFTVSRGYIEDDKDHKYSAVLVEVDPKCSPCHAPKSTSERVNLSKLQCPAQKQEKTSPEVE